MKIFLSLFLSSVLLLVGCGNERSEEIILKIGASNIPHAEILEQVAAIVEEEGIILEIVPFQDYILPNVALAEGDIDANYFQSLPYFNNQIKDHNYNFANVGGIHIEPIGVYSKTYDDLDDLPEEATVIMSNSVSEIARILSLFQALGYITLDPEVELTAATFENIVENPHNLNFEANIDASLLTQAYENEEGDVVVINANYAIDAGLQPPQDALALEDSRSEYGNIVAVREEDQHNEFIKRVVEVLQSEVIRDFMLKQYEGAVLPY